MKNVIINIFVITLSSETPDERTLRFIKSARFFEANFSKACRRRYDKTRRVSSIVLPTSAQILSTSSYTNTFVYKKQN